MSLSDLMRRVDAIYIATGGENPNAAKAEDAKLEPFKKHKRDVHMTLKGVRQMIKERDEMLSSDPSGTKTIQKSQQIRNEIKVARNAATEMQKECEKERRKKIRKLAEDEMSKREEQTELVWKHIQECERLEKRRYQPLSDGAGPSSLTGMGGAFGSQQNRSRLQGAMAGASSGTPDFSKASLEDFHPATNSDLPPIEVEEQLQQLRERDRKLDQGVEELAEGTKRLKNVALAINTELDVQAAMLDEIETKVDHANVHLLNVNRKMKETLKKVKGGDRFIVNFILLMVVLGIAAYIYTLVK